MFNMNTFNAHKQGIRETMESNLIWDKHHGTISHSTSRDYNYLTIEVKFDDEPEHVAEKMAMVVDLIKEEPLSRWKRLQSNHTVTDI